jgi:hypothetical protein
MTPYAEALETQIALASRLDTPRGRALLADLLKAAGDPPERVWEDAAFVVTMLRYAECFYWTQELAEVVADASVGLGGWVLDPRILPATCGFFWLAHPIVIAGMLRPLRAVGWMGGVTDPAIAPDRIGRYRPIRFEEIDAAHLVFFSEMDCGGLPWPSALLHVRTGVELDEAMPSATANKLRWFGAALSFMGQRIAVPRMEQADRPARRRFARQGVDHVPLLRVVELRQRDAAVRPVGGDGHGVAWSCRWFVRGHWRRQFFPAAGVNRPLWISPHLKGPESKPLKPPRATLFAVVR